MDKSTVDPGELNCEKQRFVDERFNSDTTFWREAYTRRDVFGEIYRGRQTVLLKLVDELSLAKKARVLDVGCGWGFLSISLAHRGFLVNSVDHASRMVEIARTQVKHAGLEDRIIVNVGDAHNFAFPSDSFDLVVGLGAVPWLHDLKKALAEFERVLKTGGHLVLSVDNSRSARLHWWLDFPAALRSLTRRGLRKMNLTPPEVKKNVAFSHRYSVEEFSKYLRAAGFETIKYNGVGFGPFTFFGQQIFPNAGVLLNLKLQQYSTKRFRFLNKFASQFVILAIKRPMTTNRKSFLT
jgi:ubiquinone/menaquinone biosynthesis C-methylase UbiE